MMQVVEIVSGEKHGSIYHVQYRGCWWPVIKRNQGISRHDIDLVMLEYSSLTSTITGSDNGLLPGRHQAIIWTNAGISQSLNYNSWLSMCTEMHFPYK